MPKFIKNSVATIVFLVGGALVVVSRFSIPLWIAVPIAVAAQALIWSAKKITGES
jgi:hypothetical protein